MARLDGASHRRRYEVATSQRGEVAAGTTVDSCDDRPLDAWIDTLAALENSIPGIEATRGALAPRLFVDQGNPLWRRPARCRVGGVERELAWVPIPAERWAALAPLPADIVDVPVGVSDFGERGAWIRLPAMTPRGEAEAAIYRDAIARTARLRDRDPVVFDVRGNGGGGYEWFMAMLRGLYGAAFADHYARERLKIEPVFVMGAYTARPPGTAPADPLGTPRDPELEAVIDAVQVVKSAAGTEVTVLGGTRRAATPRAQAPAADSPVRGTVFVLPTVAARAPASPFVDEMLQVRASDTSVPTRWPIAFRFRAAARLAVRTRNAHGAQHGARARERGENVPHVPSEKYPGDLQDTAAVKRWILEDLWSKYSR